MWTNRGILSLALACADGGRQSRYRAGEPQITGLLPEVNAIIAEYATAKAIELNPRPADESDSFADAPRGGCCLAVFFVCFCSVWVDTVLSTSQFLSALPETDDKTRLPNTFALMSAIVPIGPERMILQLCGYCKMFAMDLKSAHVEPVAHSLGDKYWTGWIWRDGATPDGMIVCTDNGTVAFSTRNGAGGGAVRRLCDKPDLENGHLRLLSDGTIVETDMVPLCL
jgi:hypothetical protein